MLTKPRTAATLACSAACAAVLAAPAAAPAVPADARAAAKTLTLSAPASGALRISPAAISAPAGTIVLRLRNPSKVPHNIALGSKAGAIVTRGGTSRISVRLKKGKFTYYCSVGNHRQQGMRGTLTVK